MKKATSKKDGQITPDDIIQSYIDGQDEEGINEFSKDAVSDYLISTGSLKFDQKVGGGLGAGIVRFIGPTESGKTSEAMEIAKNFLIKHENAKVIYFKCEGRLSNKIIERSGVDQSRLQVVKGRQCGFVFGLMKRLIKETRGINYLFIIDSTDALTVKDNDKKDDEAQKRVGGGNVPMVLSILLPQISDVLHELGHMCIMLSQHRDEITIGYQKKTKNVEASGGNALLHYPDWTFEYDIVRNTDLIKDDGGDAKDKEKMRVIGHTARLTIKKSMNETTHEVVHYPIKRKAPAGKSIWQEREVYDFLLMYELINKKGAWFNVDEGILNIIREANEESIQKLKSATKKLTEEQQNIILQIASGEIDEQEDSIKGTIQEIKEIIQGNEDISRAIDSYIPMIPEKIQGEDRVMTILESNPNLVEFFIDIFKKNGILDCVQDQ